MPVIEVQARSYASAAEMRAEQKASRMRLMGPIPPREPSAQIIPIRNDPPPPEMVPPPPLENAEIEIPRIMNSRWVCEHVARHFNISLGELVGQSRAREYIIPRHIAMYICVRGLGLSTLRTGDAFNRDHTTVIHAIRSVAKIAGEDRFSPLIERLMTACAVRCAQRIEGREIEAESGAKRYFRWEENRINFAIVRRRAGLSWKAIAQELSRVFGGDLTADAVKTRLVRYGFMRSA